VSGAYRGGPDGHRVALARAHTPWGDASGLATLGAEKPFPIEGGVRFVRATPPWTVDATAGLAGTLLATNVRLDGRVGTAPIEGELVLAPFEERWLARRASARFRPRGLAAAPGPRRRSGSRPRAASAAALRATWRSRTRCRAAPTTGRVLAEERDEPERVRRQRAASLRARRRPRRAAARAGDDRRKARAAGTSSWRR
jgi:hypothetical protein